MEVFEKLKTLVNPAALASPFGKTECPKCEGSDSSNLRFIWPAEKFGKKVIKVKSLRNGDTLHKCMSCKTYWLKQDSPHFTVVKNLEQIERWNSQAQVCKPEFVEDLKKIGKTNFLSFPCAVELKNGEKHTQSVISFIDEPPIWFPAEQKIIFIDEVKNLSPSPEAIPHSIREAAAELWELTMGTKALFVQTPNQEFYRIHGIKNFFSHKGTLGQDLQLVENIETQIGDPEKVPECPHSDQEVITVLADLEDYLTEL